MQSRGRSATSKTPSAKPAGRPEKIVRSTAPRYTVVIQWSDEDRCYVVSLPEWGPYCKAHGDTYGLVVEYPGAAIYALSEEHGHVDVSACDPAPEIGELVTIIPNHACGTVNVHGEIALHQSGRVVEIISVAGRGLIR